MTGLDSEKYSSLIQIGPIKKIIFLKECFLIIDVLSMGIVR